MKIDIALFVLALAGSINLPAGTEPVTATADPARGTADHFFGLTNLYTCHLTITPDQWAVMEDVDPATPNSVRPAGNPDRPGRFWNLPLLGPGGPGPMMGLEFKEGTATLEFQGRQFGPIRMRFKGNSSYRSARNSLKRSFKLDFNDLDQQKSFFGLTKLNLHNNAMDPSQMREALAYHVFRQGGVPAGRTAFARVFITVPGQIERAYAGLYTAVEQVDERFLKDRFGTKKGMLLKPEHLPGLPYWGNDWAAYTNQVQPKTTVTREDADRFIAFVKWLNYADQASFAAEVENYVAVDEFLRFLALQGLLSNLDSPLVTGHNYYLYLQPKTRKFLWLPWDLNEAFGGFNPAGTMSEQINLSVDQPYTRINLLAGRLFRVPGIKERYQQIVRDLLAAHFNAATLLPVMDAMAATIRSSLAHDPMVDVAKFEKAISESSTVQSVDGGLGESRDPRRGGPGGPFGPQRPRTALKAFIIQRSQSAQAQLDGHTKGYVPRELRPGPGGPGPAGPPSGPR